MDKKGPKKKFLKKGKSKANLAPFQKKIKKSTQEEEEISALEGLKAKLDDINPEEILSFSKLPLSKKTVKGLKDASYCVPTKVQRQSLLYSLRGLDVVAAAKTGSGKTLAFIIPLLELLYCQKWTRLDGLGALIITPTRELAYQIFEVLNNVGKLHDFSAGLVIGGKDLKYEWTRISSCNIMICTPGRLLQHMTQNAEFNIGSVQMLVLDEADQCLSMGFADTMNCILEELPSERQTLLFSATQTKDVKDLVRAGCRNPVYCSVHEHSRTITPKSLKESYIVCENHEKFTFLWSFIKHHKKCKILVFLATCKQVQYIYNMFCKLRPGLTVMGLHGSMHQLRRMAIYDEFRRKQVAVLFATDVAARGLDIPAVDWVVQADCPEDVTTYIHRVGRTARFSRSGEALILLSAAEQEQTLASLAAKNIIVEKLDVDPTKLQSINIKIEIILSKYLNLKEEAVRAFKAYVKHLTLVRKKNVLDGSALDLDAFARSLGLAVTPRVRFLEKRMKKANNKVAATTDNTEEQVTKSVNHKLTTLNFGADDSDDDEDFLSTAKDQDLGDCSLPVSPDSEGQLQQVVTGKKVQSKFAVAKKLFKKNIQVNQRLVFSEGGEAMDPAKLEALEAGEDVVSGINITKMQEMLQAEDQVDKKVHSEKKKERNRLQKKKEKEKLRKEREGEEEEEEEEEEDSEVDDFTQDIIDQLPDPDRCYATPGDTHPHHDHHSSDQSSGESSGESSAEVELHKISGKRRAREKVREAKRARLVQDNDLTELPVEEQEQLALFLLRGKK